LKPPERTQTGVATSRAHKTDWRPTNIACLGPICCTRKGKCVLNQRNQARISPNLASTSKTTWRTF